MRTRGISIIGLISCLVGILCSCSSTKPCFDQVSDITNASLQLSPSPIVHSVSISPVTNHLNPWLSFTNTNDVTQVALDNGGSVWAVGRGGVVHWDQINRIYQVFTTSDGLPDNYITAIAIGGNGQIWIGTRLGYIAKYDNKAWTTYDPPGENMVTCLALAQNGLLWIGTSNGLITFDGQGNWYSYPPQKIPDYFIHSLIITSSGSVWAGVMGWVIYYDGKSWNSKLLEKGERISSIVEAPDHTLWFSSNTALIQFDGSRWSKFQIKNGFHGISTMAINRKGEIWVADLESGIARFDENTLGFTGYEITGISSMAFGSDGTLWLGSFQKGIERLEGNTLQVYMAENEPAGNYVFSSAQAADGSVWVGSDQGVSRYDGQNWQNCTTAEGLLSNSVLAIAAAPDGSMWFGTEKGLSIYDGNSWKNYALNGLVNEPLDNLGVTSDGTVWTISRQTLFEWMARGWNLVQTPFLTPDEVIHSVSPAFRNGLWVISTKSLYYFDEAKWTSITLPPGIIPKYVIQSTDQQVWIYSDGMVLIEINGPLLQYLTSSHPRTIVLDQNGGITANPAPASDLLLNDVSWRSYGQEEGLPSGDALLIANPMDQTIWLVSNQGIMNLENGKWVNHSGPLPKSDREVNTATIDGQGSIWISVPLLGGILEYFP